jgi:hypothetical protein
LARSSDLPGARDVLTREHPLCRTLDLIDTVSMQTLVCIAMLLGVSAGAYPAITHAGALAVADAVVVTVLAGLLLALHGQRYRFARTVLIQRGAADLAELRAVHRRLAARARRERLADELTHALESALRWQDIPVARRPPPSVRRLGRQAAAVRTIVTALRASGPDVRAIAMVEELLDGGYAAPLYQLDARALEDDLSRILFTLGASRP